MSSDTGRMLMWLKLRENADAVSRAGELLDPLRAYLVGSEHLVIRDLGCGTGAMARWLAGKLPGPQHWIMHDRAPELLARIDTAGMTDAHGNPITVVAQEIDITGLSATDLSDTSLVTASALLDVLTADEIDRLAGVCATAGCPALLAMTVVGEVDFDPPDPLDAELTAAFNAHQRRSINGRRLAGPDAVTVAVEAFRRRGATVRTHASPWRLGVDQAALATQWLKGWVAVASEQQPDLAESASGYLRRRIMQCESGKQNVVVHHNDLLALPAIRESS